MASSGSYAINDTDLFSQPTIGHWVPREVFGHDGIGRPVYPGVREYEMRWEILPIASFQQLQNFYEGVESAATCVVNLPKYNNAVFIFENYSGCTLGEPSINGGYFAEDGYITDVTMTVKRIRT